MTQAEFERKSFPEVMMQLNEEFDEITTLETLREYAKQQIEEGRYFIAKNIIDALNNGNEEEWWDYDFCLGTLDKPTPIIEKKDVEHLIEN